MAEKEIKGNKTKILKVSRSILLHFIFDLCPFMFGSGGDAQTSTTIKTETGLASTSFLMKGFDIDGSNDFDNFILIENFALLKYYDGRPIL